MQRSILFTQLLPTLQLMYYSTLSSFQTIVHFALECARFLSFCSVSNNGVELLTGNTNKKLLPLEVGWNRFISLKTDLI